MLAREEGLFTYYFRTSQVERGGPLCSWHLLQLNEVNIEVSYANLYEPHHQTSYTF